MCIVNHLTTWLRIDRQGGIITHTEDVASTHWDQWKHYKIGDNLYPL